MKAIINVRIYDYSHFIDNGFVVFDKKIHKVGSMKDYKDEGYEVINAQGKLLLPNFVCSHAHIYSIFARGLILPFNPKNFQEILDQMWWKMDAQIDNEITYYSGICAGAEFLKNGVTTVIDHHASGKDIIGSLESLRKALNEDVGIRSILCFETSDRYNVKECLKENATFAKYHSDMTAGLFGFHASMSLSDKTLSEAKEVLGDTPIHIHVAESDMDEDDSYQKYHKSILERLDEHQLVNENSLIVHGVYISDKELDIVSKRKAYMVVNTTSNMNNAVGLPDIKKYQKHNIKVMVGNDGLSSCMANEYTNAFYSTRLLNKSPLANNLGDVLGFINNAYDYVNKILKIKIGRIEENYLADFLLVNYTPFTQMDDSNIFGHIFYGLYPNFLPEDVYVNGKELVHNYQFTDKSLNTKIINSRKVSNRLWKTLKEE